MCKIKLSKPQQLVVDALKNNDGAVLVERKYYHWSQVLQGDKVILLSVYKPTVHALIRNGIITSISGTINQYKLTPNP